MSIPQPDIDEQHINRWRLHIACEPEFVLSAKFQLMLENCRKISLYAGTHKQLEALGYTFVESDLFDYSDSGAWKKVKPYPIERMLASYWFFGSLVVIEDSR